MGSPKCDDQVFDKSLPCDWAVNGGTPPSLLQPALNADVKSGKETDQSLLHPERCSTETMVLYGPVGAPVPADGTFVTTSVMLLLPTSRGRLHIVSASPLDAPAIDANFYDTEIDRTALIHGNEEAPPDMPNLTEESSDADIDMKIRMTGLFHVHSAGTAAMGKVIDSQLRVKGVKGSRIADASIFPTAIGGHP
ncbi:GMC oxidoreductase-domain-containing protein [Usnea florida]